MGDDIKLKELTDTWKNKKKKQEPQPSTSTAITADIIVTPPSFNTKFIPIYLQASTSSAPDPVVTPEPVLLPELLAEAEAVAEAEAEAEANSLDIPERRRTASETRLIEKSKKAPKTKTKRRRTNSENECEDAKKWPTRLLFFKIKSHKKSRAVVLQVPKLVIEQIMPKPAKKNTTSKEKLLQEQSLDESVDLLNDTSISDNSVQEFRSLPNLRDVQRAANCRKCKRTAGSRKKCWEVFADWCRFPRMKCACMDTNSYERLPSVGGYLALSSYVGSGVEDKDSSTEKQEELLFYNDDNSYQSVVVERNLCASDLCQLLAVKNRVGKDVNWTIVEHWVDLGLERLLEDHEDVLSAHRDMENYSRHAEVRLVFRKEFRKYEFFHHPQQFFPPDMIDVEHCESLGNTGLYTSNPGSLMNLVTRDGECPSVFSNVWVQDPNKQIWSKGFLLLRDKKLYLSYKVQVVAKFLRTGKQKDSTYYPVSEADAGQLTVFARLSDYHVYTTLNAKNQFRAPTEWGICLRPSGIDSNPTADLDDDVDYAGTVGASKASLRCLACDSERARTCWLTAMRLAKYGKQLRENYRAFKNKQVDSINPKEYNSYTVPNESVRSRVAMDFTGSVGRIVEDPKEAKAIAAAEGYSWRRRWRPSTRAQAPPHSPVTQQGIDSGVHITQPWFHSGMSRDQAAALVTRYGTVDGVFLVRDSRSNPGAFVLTYKCGGKVLHTQITPILDPVREAYVFTLDNGFTKFYDLLQLVEFYQLNAGVLPTRLTHYVVQSPTGISVPASNVSPSVAGSF